MATKKEVLSELKKYNKELEKHIPKLDFSFLNEEKILDNTINENSNINEEILTLFLENINEVKTEIALLRKNLSIEIEGIVQRDIEKYQTEFFTQTNKFYSKIIFEVKENFNKYILQINEELNGLKNFVMKIHSQSESFDKKLSVFNEELLKFKEMANRLELEFTKSVNPLEKGIENINSEINKLKDNLDELSEEIKNERRNLGSNFEFINERINKIVGKFGEMNYKLEKVSEDEKFILEEKVVDKTTPKIRKVKSYSVKNPVKQILDIEAKLKRLEQLKE